MCGKDVGTDSIGSALNPAALRLPKPPPCRSGDSWHHPVLCFRCSCHWPIRRESGGPHGITGCGWHHFYHPGTIVAPSWHHHDIIMTDSRFDPTIPVTPGAPSCQAFTSGLREALLDASKLISGTPSFRASVIRDGKRLGLKQLRHELFFHETLLFVSSCFEF